MKIKVEQISDTVAITAWTLQDGKEKKLATPCEYCDILNVNNPTEASINYWKAHGIDRNNIRLT